MAEVVLGILVAVAVDCVFEARMRGFYSVLDPSVETTTHFSLLWASVKKSEDLCTVDRKGPT